MAHTTSPARTGHTRIRPPEPPDAQAIWRLAGDTVVLDRNSSYAYLMFCRDFADTCRIAEIECSPAGFVVGYVRPGAPDTLFVWQVAVTAEHRGRGLAGAMLDDLLDTLAPRGVTDLETTITADNTASITMFTTLAERRDATIARQPLFGSADFPDQHAAEDLYTIRPRKGRSIR